MFLDTLIISFKNLGRQKMRSFLTVLGIAIGVASVVLIASIGDIGKYTINEELSSLGVQGVLISRNNKVAGTQLTQEHLEAIRGSGTVDSAIPLMVDYSKTYMRELTMDTVVWGIESGSDQAISLEALHGRLFTNNDVTACRYVCVVDQNVAQAYYKRDNIVGKTLAIQFAGGNQEFEVVGVASSGGNLMQGLMGSIIPSFVYIPYTTMQALSGTEDFDQIVVRTREGVDGDVAGTQLVSAMNRLSGVNTGFKAENMAKGQGKLNNVLDTVTMVLSAIAGVSLVVAGLSTMTMMLVSVGERTREIGIKKSIGATRRMILYEFLIEAFTISLLGSLIGTALGILCVVVGCLPFGVTICINVELVLFCIVFSVCIGTVFGVYPASVAAKLRPVDALRCE